MKPDNGQINTNRTAAWGGDDFNKRPMSYTAAAGAQGGVHRTLDASNFNEQFPPLEGSPSPPVSSTSMGKPSLAQQLQASRPGAANGPSNGAGNGFQTTRANAQAILNAVKQASLGDRPPQNGQPLQPTQLGKLQTGTAPPPGLASHIQKAAAPDTAAVSGLANAALNSSHIGTSNNLPTAPLTEIERYGLKGLSPLLRGELSDQTTIAIGIDPNMLGLDVSSTDPKVKLGSNFVSPWLETSRSEVQSLFMSPASFIIPQQDLPPVETRLSTFSDETLFFIFYSKPRDTLQELSARELNSRNWRYLKDLQVWLTKDSSVEPVPNGPGSERGTYIFFDPTSWEYVTKDFVLSYQSII